MAPGASRRQTPTNYLAREIGISIGAKKYSDSKLFREVPAFSILTHFRSPSRHTVVVGPTSLAHSAISHGGSRWLWLATSILSLRPRMAIALPTPSRLQTVRSSSNTATAQIRLA